MNARGDNSAVKEKKEIVELISIDALLKKNETGKTPFWQALADGNYKLAQEYLADINKKLQEGEKIKPPAKNNKKIKEIITLPSGELITADDIKKCQEHETIIKRINNKLLNMTLLHDKVLMDPKLSVAEFTTLLKLSQIQAQIDKFKTKTFYDIITDTDTFYGEALIHMAARSARYDLIEVLIGPKNVDGKYKNIHLLNYQDANGKTVLHHAIENGHFEILTAILRHIYSTAKSDDFPPVPWANVHIRDNEGKTPLHYAAQRGDINLIKKLLEFIPKNLRDNLDHDGKPPLFYAIQSGNLAAVKLLIQDTNVNHVIIPRGREAVTALHYAARFGTLQIFEELFKENKSTLMTTDRRGRNILHYAMRSGNKKILIYLLNHIPQYKIIELLQTVDHKGQTPLHIAAKYKKQGVVNIITERAWQGDKPWSIKNRQLLLDLIKQKDQNEETPLSMAIGKILDFFTSWVIPEEKELEDALEYNQPAFLPHSSSLREKNEEKKQLQLQQEQKVQYNVLREAARKYVRAGDDHSYQAQFQVYASGEYLAHHLAYKNLIDHSVIPILNDNGFIRDYRVHNLINEAGLISTLLIPIYSSDKDIPDVHDIKIIFRGTASRDAAVRDLDKEAAGIKDMERTFEFLLDKINDTIKHEFNDNAKINCSILGHSLGANDSQVFFTKMMHAKAQALTEHDPSQAPPGLKGVLSEVYNPSSIDGFDRIKGLRLQTYNPPGTSKQISDEADRLAPYLADNGIALDVNHMVVSSDPVSMVGGPLIGTRWTTRSQKNETTSNMEDRIRVKFLKFKDYFHAIHAHTDKQFNGGPIKSETRQYEFMENNEKFPVRSANPKESLVYKIEPTHPFYVKAKLLIRRMAKKIKRLNARIKLYFHKPTRTRIIPDVPVKTPPKLKA